MRYLIASLLVTALVAAPVRVYADEPDTTTGAVEYEAPKTIGGAMVGFGVSGEHKQGGVFASYFAGLNVTPERLRKRFPKSNLFLAGQQVDVASGGSGFGLKAVLQNRWSGVPELSTLLDVGFASDVATNADGEMVTGITVGGGLNYMTGDLLGFFIYGNGIDTGDAFDWWIALGIVAIDPTTLLGL